MKRTIKEIYDIIKEKRDNAFIDYVQCQDALSLLKADKLKHQIEAYDDVLSLIESSYLLEEDEDKMFHYYVYYKTSNVFGSFHYMVNKKITTFEDIQLLKKYVDENCVKNQNAIIVNWREIDE